MSDHKSPHGEVILRTAHDVRYLRVCAKCEGVGDDRNMISPWPIHDLDRDARWHPRCFFEQQGDEDVLLLCESERGKFRICDIPKSLMKRLVQTF